LLPQTVALMCGLDHSRDFATRYPQEQLFRQLLELAVEIELPVVLFVSGDDAMPKMVELLNEQAEKEPVRAVALYNFVGTKADFDVLSQVNGQTLVYYLISGVICDPSHERGQALRGFLKDIPRNRLLLCSDAPKYTPQNMDDEYLRTQKNEPSNLTWVVSSLAEVLDVDPQVLTTELRTNTKTFYQLYDQGEAPISTKEEGEESSSDDEDDDKDEVPTEVDTKQSTDEKEPTPAPVPAAQNAKQTGGPNKGKTAPAAAAAAAAAASAQPLAKESGPNTKPAPKAATPSAGAH